MKLNLFAQTGLAETFRKASFCLWDIGARGGMDPHFGAFAFAIDAVGFEPDPAAHAALAPSGNWQSESFFPVALGGVDSGNTLNITRDPAGSSFLRHDPAVGARYGLEALFDVEKSVEIPTHGMERAIVELGVPAPNLLKLDIEGLEKDVLESGGGALDGVVAVKLEASFFAHRINQPLAGDLIAYMRSRGFCLADIIDQVRWRKRPWAADPFLVREAPAYSRGRLAQADLIFLREPDTVTSETAETAALAAIGLGYFDHGLELLEAGGRAAEAASIKDAVHQAARVYGRARAREEVGANFTRLKLLLRSLAGGLNVPRGKP